MMKYNSTRRITGIIFITLAIGFNLDSQSISSSWYSILKIEGMELSFNIHITANENGLSGTFDVPEQGALGVPLSSVTLEGSEFTFAFNPAGFKFSGLTDPEFSSLVGYFSQGTINEKLEFTKDRESLPETVSAKVKRLYDKKEVYIEMRDGIELFTSIYTPKSASEASPILMFRSPYNSEPDGEEAYNFFINIYERFVDEEYIFVFQDVRGRYMSEGEFVHVRPFNPHKKGSQTDEASDTYDTADWLIKNVENNNGNIGVTGTSYPGFYATMAVLAGHPAIKAVSPQAPIADWFMGDDWHHNGAFFLIDGFNFQTWFGDPHYGESRVSNRLNFSYGMEDNYTFFLELGPIKNTKEIIPDSLYYWYELMDHPNYDDWWKATVPLPHLKKVNPAVMTVGGWFDAEDLYGALHTYEALESQNKSTHPNHLVMGPWSHGQWAFGDARNLGNIYWDMSANELYHQLEVDFFNYYLKGQGSGDFSEAYIYMTGDNEWQTYDAWPPADASEKMIFFAPNGALSFSEPTIDDSFVEYLSDPERPVPYMEDVHMNRSPEYMNADQRFASRRPDVVVYQTDILEEDLELTGKISADLFVSTTGTDADFIVKIINVFPDQMRPPADAEIDVPLGGYQMLVRGEVMRGKFRNSFENPEAFVPGEVTKVSFDIPDVAHTFKKGHRLMIQVQSSWFPLVDRNPQKFVDIYNCDASDFQKAYIRIYSDKEHPSGIRVMTR